MKPKTIRESQVIMAHEAIPPDANPAGNVHGGTIMKLIDAAAGVVVGKGHFRHNAVTIWVENLEFLSPAYIGDYCEDNSELSKLYLYINTSSDSRG